MATTTVATTLNTALSYLDSGLSVIPCRRADKLPDATLLPLDPITKKPTWKPYQKHPADTAQARQWFQNGASVAIVCGAVSGGLVVLDFDKEAISRGLHRDWYTHTQHLAAGLPIVQTGNGYQVYLRTTLDIRNAQLACYALPPNDEGREQWGVLVETRGEGGYVIAPPSIHPSGRTYKIIRGDLSAIPLLSDDDTRELLAACRAYDERPAPRPRQPGTNQGSAIVTNTSTYIERALQNELAQLRSAGQGRRNSQLNRSAYSLGQLIGAGLLDYNQTWDTLYDVACDIGLDQDGRCGVMGIEKTIASGLTAGMKTPRQIRARPQPSPRLPAPTPTIDSSQEELAISQRQRGRPTRYDPSILLAWLTNHSDCGAYLGSNAEICDELQWTERAVQRALQTLEDQQHITRIQHQPGRLIRLGGDKNTNAIAKPELRGDKNRNTVPAEDDKNQEYAVLRGDKNTSNQTTPQGVTKIEKASGSGNAGGDKNTQDAIIETRAPDVKININTSPNGKLNAREEFCHPSETPGAAPPVDELAVRRQAYAAVFAALADDQEGAREALAALPPGPYADWAQLLVEAWPRTNPETRPIWISNLVRHLVLRWNDEESARRLMRHLSPEQRQKLDMELYKVCGSKPQGSLSESFARRIERSFPRRPPVPRQQGP